MAPVGRPWTSRSPSRSGDSESRSTHGLAPRLTLWGCSRCSRSAQAREEAKEEEEPTEEEREQAQRRQREKQAVAVDAGW